MLNLLKEFGSEVKKYKSIRNMVDYYFFTYTKNILFFEFFLVLVIGTVFQNRLFDEDYDYSNRSLP